MNAAKTPRPWPYCDGACELEGHACNDPMRCPPGLTELDLDRHRAEMHRMGISPRVNVRLAGALVGGLLLLLVSCLSGCGGGDADADEQLRIAEICQALTVHVPGNVQETDRLTHLWRQQCFDAGGVVPPEPTPGGQ